MKPWKPKYVLWMMDILFVLCVTLAGIATAALVWAFILMPAAPPPGDFEAGVAHTLAQQYCITIAGGCIATAAVVALCGKLLGYWAYGNIQRYYMKKDEECIKS